MLVLAIVGTRFNTGIRSPGGVSAYFAGIVGTCMGANCIVHAVIYRLNQRRVYWSAVLLLIHLLLYIYNIWLCRNVCC